MRSTLRAVAATRSPRSSAAIAHSRPSPVVVPVMNQIFSVTADRGRCARAATRSVVAAGAGWNAGSMPRSRRPLVSTILCATSASMSGRLVMTCHPVGIGADVEVAVVGAVHEAVRAQQVEDLRKVVVDLRGDEQLRAVEGFHRAGPPVLEAPEDAGGVGAERLAQHVRHPARRRLPRTPSAGGGTVR